MTSQSPRIYIYKITFEEVPYYYYGVHKEKYFNEEYWGSPVTHKWCWDFYTPKKQILEVFDYTDEGWLEAQEVETRLIKPFYNTDKWCLNENCGGIISLEVLRKNGRHRYENKIGMFSLTSEERSELGKIGGNYAKENKLGIFSLSKEERDEMYRKNTQYAIENKIAVFSLTSEERSAAAKNAYANGLDKATPEQRTEWGRMGYYKSLSKITSEQFSENGKKVCSQKWECTETGFVANPGNLTQYQRRRGIDTSKRIRLE